MADLTVRRGSRLPAETLFEDFLTWPFWGRRGANKICPCVDVREMDNKMIFEFDIPGVNKEDINVSVRNNILRVYGNRKTETEEQETDYLRREVTRGEFEREFSLPRNINPNSLNAEYKNGVLYVTADKTDKKKTEEHAIEIK